MKSCSKCHFNESDDSHICSKCGGPLYKSASSRKSAKTHLGIDPLLASGAIIAFLLTGVAAGLAGKPLSVVAGVLGAMVCLPVAILRDSIFFKIDREFTRFRFYGIIALIALFTLFGLVLSPRIPTEQRAKQLGFASIEEMRRMHERGYESMAEYRETVARDPEFFIRECKSASRDDYKARCYGKKVTWKGSIESFGSDGAHIEILNLNGSRPSKKFAVDVPSLSSQLDEKVDVSKVVTFDGRIGNQNIIFPDIDKAKIVSLESDTERAERETNARTAERAELNTHLNDAEWLANKFALQATSPCKAAIEQLATNNYMWYDGWAETKFPSYLTAVRQPGVVVLTGNKVKFQNGFGGWVIMSYECAYDVVKQRVVTATASPRY